MSQIENIIGKPITGLGGVILSITVPTMEDVTMVAQCVAAVAGAIVVVLNVFITVKKIRSKKNNHLHEK